MTSGQDEGSQAGSGERQEGEQQQLTVGQIAEQELPGGGVTPYLDSIRELPSEP